MVDIKDVIFLNEPIPCKMGDYEQSLEGVVASLKVHPEIFSIHQIGEISCSGISDIDLLIVIDKDFKGDLRYLDVRKLNYKDRYLFPHQMYIIPSSLVDDFKFLFPIFSINTLYGPSIQKGDYIKELDLILLTDISILRWPWEFLVPLAQRRIENRRLLGRLISLRHSLRLYQQVCGQTHEGLEELVQESLNLAKNWFFIEERRRQKALVEKIWQAYLMTDDLLGKFNLFLKDIIAQQSSNGRILFINTNHLVFFESDMEVKKKTAVSLEMWRNKNIMVSFLPKEFAFSLVFYRNSNNGLGHYIRKNLKYNKKIKFKIPQSLRYILSKRLELLDKQIKFLGNNYLAFGYFMNFDYIYPFNLKYRLRSCLKTLNTMLLNYRYFRHLSTTNQ